MTHPIEAVIVNGSSVDKGALREELKKYVRDFGSVAAFRLLSLAGVEAAVIADKLYYFDSADLSTADNGTTCVHDVDGRRFKQATVSASVSGQTIFSQTALGGTANALTVTTDGMAALSSTPQYIIITPSAACTGTVTIAYDGGAVLALLSNTGSALAADELLPRPTLIRATSTDSRIITPW